MNIHDIFVEYKMNDEQIEQFWDLFAEVDSPEGVRYLYGADLASKEAEMFRLVVKEMLTLIELENDHDDCRPILYSSFCCWRDLNELETEKAAKKIRTVGAREKIRALAVEFHQKTELASMTFPESISKAFGRGADEVFDDIDALIEEDPTLHEYVIGVMDIVGQISSRERTKIK